MASYMPPVGGEKHNYFPLPDECADSDGQPYPEHDFWDEGNGYRCRRCGADIDEYERS